MSDTTQMASTRCSFVFEYYSDIILTEFCDLRLIFGFYFDVYEIKLYVAALQSLLTRTFVRYIRTRFVVMEKRLLRKLFVIVTISVAGAFGNFD